MHGMKKKEIGFLLFFPFFRINCGNGDTLRARRSNNLLFRYTLLDTLHTEHVFRMHLQMTTVESFLLSRMASVK